MLLQGPFFSFSSLQTLSTCISFTHPTPLGLPACTPHFSMWKARLPCLCLAALLPGVSVACACVSARTQYL